MKNDNVELIHSTLAGDDNAFSLLMGKYQASIHELALRKIGDAHIAEDITQDIFLKVHQKLDMLEKPQNFGSWLHVIATHCCIDWLRKKHLMTETQSK